MASALLYAETRWNRLHGYRHLPLLIHNLQRAYEMRCNLRVFFFRHVHPFDPPGKTILQAVDPEEALRLDFFSDAGIALGRAQG